MCFPISVSDAMSLVSEKAAGDDDVRILGEKQIEFASGFLYEHVHGELVFRAHDVNDDIVAVIKTELLHFGTNGQDPLSPGHGNMFRGRDIKHQA